MSKIVYIVISLFVVYIVVVLLRETRNTFHHPWMVIQGGEHRREGTISPYAIHGDGYRPSGTISPYAAHGGDGYRPNVRLH